jgi:DDE superfamily endonuclease
MNRQELLDIYSDYLVSAFGQTTGTGLAAMLEGSVSHDQVQRFLAGPAFTSADLWQVVKGQVRAMQSDDGVMIIDDSIAEKPYTDENDIICWHYDHAKSRSVKGIGFVSAMYHARGLSLPVGFRLIAKTETYFDTKDGKQKRRSSKTKNEHYRELLRQAVRNRIPFKFVLNDVWYAAADNMKYIKHDLKKDFIMPIKSNRKLALSLDDKQQGRLVTVDTLQLEPQATREVYLESVDFPLLLVKQVFTNEDGSVGVLYLVSSDTTLTYDQMTTLYQKRWNVEPYHKSLKQNASLEKSPSQTVTSQTNHFFASLCGYVKLEMLKRSTKLNHFALKSKLYLKAVQVAFETLQQLQSIQLAA